MVIAVDANFRLSNKINRSTDQTDPCLTDGRAYVANTAELQAYTTHADIKKQKKEKASFSR